MKLAKKMLACVIALALLGCCAINAFAAEDAIAIKTSINEEDKTLTATIQLKNATGLKSADVVLTYNSDVLAFSYNEDAADAEVIGKTKSNTFTSDANGTVAGEVRVGFYFKTELQTPADTKADLKKASDAAEVVYTEANFNAIDLVFDIKGEVANANIKFSGSYTSSKTADKIAIGTEAEPKPVVVEVPTTAAPVTEAPTEAPTTGIPATGDPNTGDNMALAAAAGVILLAGAAFVITKKRK